MKILLPWENALFMRNWRPKTRPERLVPMVVFEALLLALMIFQAYWANMGNRDAEIWPRAALALVLGTQGLVFLLMGAYEAGSAAFQEAGTGAMDFHRASATSPLNQMLGLVFGGTVTAYILFILPVPLGFILAVVGKVTIGDYLQMQISLLLTGVLCHVFSALAGMRAEKKIMVLSSPAIGLVFVGIVHIAAMSFLNPFWSLPAYVTSLPVIVSVFSPEGLRAVPSHLFGFALPRLLLQAIVQVPLILIAATALHRAVSRGGRPAFSKSLALGLAAFLLVLGTSIAYVKEIDAAQNVLWVGFLIYALLVGCSLAFAITPGYGIYCQGLRRDRKRGGHGFRPFGDGSGNLWWSLAFAVVVGACFWLIRWPLGSPGAPAATAAMLVYFGVFAAALEYFRLGPSKRRGSIFIVVIVILWFLIPAFGFFPNVVMVGDHSNPWTWYAMSTCPFFGIPAIADHEHRFWAGHVLDWQTSTTWVIFAVNILLLAAFLLLGRFVRAEIARRVERQELY